MDSKFLSIISFYFNQIYKGETKSVFKAIMDKIYSENLAFGFKYNLLENSSKPRVLIKTIIREFKNGDMHHFKMDKENNELIKQLPTCYVAVTKKGDPCFRIWYIDHKQNKKIKEFWGDTFPQLKKDEVLLESAFTVSKYRGMGLHPAIMIDILEKRKKKGIKYAFAFASIKNVNSIRSFYYASFHPYTLRREKWFLFKKSIIFEEIPNDLKVYHKKITGNRN